jgi:tetratricopeptide (TPR) repeat protein
MATVLRLSVRVIICLTLSLCSAYGREGPLPPVPPTSVPSSEACTPDTVVWGTRRNAEAATVSVISMLVLQKAKRAYEHAARALAGNYLEDAEKELNSALETYPKSAVAWCLMGTLNEERLQFDKAFMDYSQALLAGPHLLAAYLGLARIAFQQQRWQEVIEITDQVVRANPIAFPVTYLYDAAANFNLGNFTAAEKSARKFQCFDTEHERPQVYLLLGDILTREHDYAGAAEQKKRFLTIVPDAYDAEEINEQIKTLEDLSGGTEKSGSTNGGINANTTPHE